MLASLEDLMLRVKVGIIFKSASDRHLFPHFNILQSCHVCFSSTFPLHHYIIITYMQYGTSPSASWRVVEGKKKKKQSTFCLLNQYHARLFPL